jgi:hypothetical protein
LNNIVKDMDMAYPPEWRLSKGNRLKGMSGAKPAGKSLTKAGTVAGKLQIRKAARSSNTRSKK